jgi:VWFA-related protein
MKRLRAAVLICATMLPLVAQETIKVHVVEVPVTVLDKSGNPIRNLKASDFSLFEDGKAQAITAFDAIDFTSNESVSAISPLNPNARRSFLLLFDLGYGGVKQLERARIAAKSFVTQNVLPRDLIAVGMIDPMKGFTLLTSFTTDRNAVASAIADPQKYHGSDPLQLSDADPFGETLSGGGGTSASSGGGGRGGEADAETADVRDMIHRDHRAFVIEKVGRQINSLSVLANLLGSVRGHKQVILLSSGFDASIVRGRAGRGAINADMSDMRKAVGGTPYLIDNDARFGNTASQDVVGEMTKLFKQSDVVLHAIDVGGIRVDGEGSAPVTVSNDGLHMLADPTGGTVFENSNNLHSDFERMVHEQEVVYVLAFQTSAPSGKLHNLSVKVDVPSSVVHNRLAYYDSATPTAVERVLSNAEIIVNDIPQQEIRIASLPVALPAANRGAVPIFLEINGDDLLRGAMKATAVDIFVYAFDEQGIVRDRLYQRIAVDPSRASANLREHGIKYFATLALPKGRYAIKSLVAIPETQRRGFARSDLTVGGSSDVILLPPLFFDRADQWAMVKGAQHDATPYALQLNGEPFVPSALPRVSKSAESEFALFLYNANPEEMLLQASAVDSAGAAHPVSPALVRTLKGDGVTKLVFRYQPSDLALGPATLNLSVRKKDSADVHKASVGLMVTN